MSRGDAEYFSKLTGESTALAASQSASRALLLPWADRDNRGAGEVARPVLTPAELRTLGDRALVVSRDRQPFLVQQRPWFRVPALARLVPLLSGEGDALAACRRPASLPDPRLLGEIPVVVAGDSLVVGPQSEEALGDPVSPPPEPPAAGKSSPGERVERARPKRARMPRQAVMAAEATVAVATEPTTIIATPPMLTPREAQLLAALAADPAASSATLGGGLGVAAATIRKALGGLREKLGAEKDADGAVLVALARERGVSLDEGGGR